MTKKQANSHLNVFRAIGMSCGLGWEPRKDVYAVIAMPKFSGPVCFFTEEALQAWVERTYNDVPEFAKMIDDEFSRIIQEMKQAQPSRAVIPGRN